MKTSSDKVVKAGAGYVIGNYLLKGITFLSAPIFVRLLSQVEYGNVSLYYSYEAILYILVGMAIHSSINNAKYKYEEKLDEYVSSIILLNIVSFLIWMVVANLLFNQYAHLVGFDRLIINALIVHCLASSLYQIYNTYIGLFYDYKAFVKLSWVYALANIVLSVFLVLTFFSKDRFTGRVLGITVPMAFIGIYIVCFFSKKAKPVFKADYWAFGLTYSLPIIPHGISQVILSSFDRIMIKNMVGAKEVGIYSFAYNIYQIIMVASNSLQHVWKPWMYEKMDAKEYGVIRKRGTDYAFGMGMFTVLVLMVAPEIILILGTEEYRSAINSVVPILIGGYFAFLYSLPSLTEYFYGKTKYIGLGTMGAAGINIVLNYIFIPYFGYVAAAYTTLATYICYFVFHYLLARRIHGSNLFATGQLIICAGGVILAGVVSILLEDYWLIRWALELLLGVLFLLWANKQFPLAETILKKIKR